MKMTFKRVIPLQIAVLLLAGFISTPFTCSAVAESEVPFRGNIESVEIATVEYPLLFVDASGTGVASHLGRFTLTYELVVDLLTLPFETSGSSIFTAANGDELTTEIVGRGAPDGDTVSVVEVHTVTGGTGRFAEATGSFIRTYLLDRITGATSGSLNGSLVLH